MGGEFSVEGPREGVLDVECTSNGALWVIV